MTVELRSRRFDPERDHAARWDTHPEVHPEVMNAPTGVWRCRKAYNSTDCGPREIQVTERIADLKRDLAHRGT